MQLPCIILWKSRHFAVVYKITKNKVLISDPQAGLRKYSYSEFCNGWIVPYEDERGKLKKRGVCIICEPTIEFQNSTSNQNYSTVSLSLWKYIFKYLKYYKSSIYRVFSLIVVITILNVFIPVISQSIFDFGVPARDTTFITIMLVASVVMTLSGALSQWLKQLINVHFAAKIKLAMQSDFITKLTLLPIQFFENRLMGDIIQRKNDYDRLEEFIMNSSLNFVMGIFQMIVYGSVLLYYNRIIFIIFVAGSILYLSWIIIFWNVRKQMDIKYFGYISKDQSQWIEMLTNISDIKCYNYYSIHRRHWERNQIKLFKTKIKLLNVEQVQTVGSKVIISIEDLILIYIGAMSVMTGEMTLGMLFAIQYLLGQLKMPVECMSQYFISMQLAKISYSRVSDVLNKASEDETSPRTKTIEIDKPHEDLTINNLYFRYTANSDYVLKNISLTIPKGTRVAIIGDSGCGKSTFLNLLIGLYMPSSGKIKVGFRPLNSIPTETWRSRIGVLTQQSSLMADTIYNNIVFGRSFNPNLFEEALEIAHLRKEIESMPLSYNTIIQENGRGVSEGQKQRILIARAIYGRPDYLFLDEATSALDANNESHLLEAIKNLEYNPTIFFITHRISSARMLDLVLLFKDGTLIERGSHMELLKKQGYYHKYVISHGIR